MSERKEVISFCCDTSMLKEIDARKLEGQTRGYIIRKLLKAALEKEAKIA